MLSSWIVSRISVPYFNGCENNFLVHSNDNSKSYSVSVVSLFTKVSSIDLFSGLILFS